MAKRWSLSEPIMCECFLCVRKVQCGPHRYDGRNIPEWGVLLCNGCLSGNWDGIVENTDHGQRLVAHLNASKLAIVRNAAGHIVIPQ